MSAPAGSEPFPSLEQIPVAVDAPQTQDAPANTNSARRSRTTSLGSKRSSVNRARNRTSSLVQSIASYNPPLGMWQATGEVGSKIPTLNDIRHGGFGDDGWTHEGQMERRGANPHEIHRRRLHRSSTDSRRTRASTLSPVSAANDDVREYFPTPEKHQESAAIDAARIPSTINEGEARALGPIIATYDLSSKPADILMATEEAPSRTSSVAVRQVSGPDETGTYPNGYRFPNKHTWTQSTVIGLKAFWKFAMTPFGFIITVYGLNVVAWGAMIFFVLLNAAPAMCHPSCNANSSARKKWIEIDSQVLNGLFCVTGFGLIPWRFRDFYYLIRWRLFKDHYYHRKLAGINRGWYRLPGSERLPDDVGPPPVYNKKNPQTPESSPPYTEQEIAELEGNPAIPVPATSMPPPPLTGARAPPTRSYMIDIVVWMYVLNTGFQACLAGFMWGMNRFNRPSWATGFFISIGCVVAMVAGIVTFIEGSKVKKVEGIPVHEHDVFEELEKKEDKREAKKEMKRTKSDKVKGKHWFERR